MMVGDDEVEAEIARCFSLGKGAHAGVNRDDETNACRVRFFKHAGLQSIAFAQAVRHMKASFAAQHFNSGLEQNDGGGAVHIVVAVEQNRLMARDGRFKAFDGRSHAQHEEGIVELG